MSLHQFSTDMGVSLLIQLASRGIWYLAVLALTGWLLWISLYKLGGNSQSSVAQISLNLQRFHIFALILMILSHLEELLDGGGLDEIPSIFLSTSVGIGWLILLAFSIIGLFILPRLPMLNYVWILGLLLVSSMYGHSATGDPQWLTMFIGFIHLSASAIVVGGLFYAMMIWKIQRDQLLPFARKMLLGVICSIIVLTITGIISTLLLLPSISYLFSTQWGWLLLVKVVLTLFMIILCILLLRKLRNKQPDSVVQGLKVSIGFSIVIVLIVGCITYMSPTPTNKPLFWHEMGETVHMSARITPMFVGPNTFRAKIWVSNEEQAPELVQMQLHCLDRIDQPPILIPLTPYMDTKKEAEFEGFTEYSYKTEDRKIPYNGNWRVEVHVKRVTGDEVIYPKEFKLN